MAAVRPLDDTELQVWHLFLSSHSALMRKLGVELADETDLTLPAYEVLAHLSQAPQQRMPMSTLAASVNLSLSGISRLVDRLARLSLVTRTRYDQDGRVVFAVLTDAGAARLAAAYPVHLRGVREHFIDRLDRDQLTALATVLRRVLAGPPPEVPGRPAATAAGGTG